MGGRQSVSVLRKVSRASSGGYVYEPGKNDSLKPSIAATTDATGQPCYIVAFESLAEWNGLPLQQGGNKDVFVYNQCLGETSRIVLDRNDLEPFDNIHSMAPSISAVTRTGSDYSYYVAFQSWAQAQLLNNVYLPGQLVEGSESQFLDSDIFIYFIEPAQNPVIDVASIDNSDPPNLGGNGAPFRGDSLTPAISVDGCYVVFKSRATNLEETNPTPVYDTNYETDVFTRFRCDP